MVIRRLLNISVFILMLMLTPPSGQLAAAPQAITASHASIPVDELDLKLRPLRRDAVKVEVEAWLALLAEHIAEVSAAEIAVKYKLREISMAQEIVDALVKTEEAKAALTQSPEDPALQAAVTEADATYNRLIDDMKAMVRQQEGNQGIDAVTQRAERHVEEMRKSKPEPEPEVADGGEGDSQASDDKTVSETQAKLEAAIRERDRQRAVLLEYLTDLRTQQTALIERANTVVNVFEEKGGDPDVVDEYRKYISSVSGVQVDVSDFEATWKTISGWAMSKEGGLQLLKNFAIFVIVILIAIFLGRLVSRAIESVVAKTRQTSQLLGDFLIITARRLILALGILIGLAALGVNIGPLLALIGAAGFVVAFALQNSLGNFASGILVMVFKPFDLGDLVEIGGELGVVKSMNLLSVTLHTLDNRAVTIPNNNVWSGSITNVNGTNTRRVDLVFGIAYDDDMGKAQKLMEEVVKEHPLVLDDPAPVVRVHELADSSVNFVCRPWVKTSDYWDVYWDVTRKVKERFDEEGVSIPFPQRDLHIYNSDTESIALPGDSNKKKAQSAPASS
jgi:small conductance mechanosensitive channel